MLGGAISSAIDQVVSPYFQTETFDGSSKTPDNDSGKAALVAFLTLLVILLLLLLVGKFLWNGVLVTLMPFIKPAKSIWQILGLSILISLISPGCSVMA
jgi:hypothetical protein